ncbi:MAG TPA: alpha/beta hydrolase [Blastocatellia bacterium]|nr:alpha/beta hydrolase [Blastocatellia bacterium]
MNKSSRQSMLKRASTAVLAALLLVPFSISTAAQELKALGAELLQARTPARLSSSQPEVSDRYATVFGAKIHYLEAGSGPVVILLHGLGGDASNWAPTVGALSLKYRVIVPDQIGFGKSDKPLMNYRVGTLVDFLAGLYKELKIERASLVGNSLGGWTAAAFALAHPEKVDRLVLVDAAGFRPDKSVDPRTFNTLNPSTRDDARKVLSAIFYNKSFTSDVAVDLMFARRIAAGDGYTIQRFIDSIIHGEDMLDGRLSGLEHQTLIVWGREDLLTPIAMGERFRKEIPNSELLVFDKCGHVPQIEKAPEFNAAVLKFLGNGENAGK